MNALVGKTLWLSTGLVIGAGATYFLKSPENPVILFANQAAQAGINPEPVDLGFAEKGALIIKIKEADKKFEAMRRLGSEWLPASIDESLEFRDSIKSSPKVREAFDQGAIPILAKLDPEKTLELVDEGPWWPEQWESEREALRTIAESKPEWVLERIGKTEDPYGRYQKFTGVIITEMAKKAPESAVRHAERLTEGPTKKRVFEQAAAQWVKSDPLGTSEWLQGLPPGESRDAAINAFVNAIRIDNPSDAFVWAVSIDDSNQKVDCLKKVIKTWFAQGGSGAAQRAITEAKLSPEELGILREAFPDLN